MDHCCILDLDHMNVVLHLDELLLKLHSQVSPKWRQFGFAVRLPVETLDELSSYQEEDRLSEIADYWMKQHQGQLTWREVARIIKEIDLTDLAEEILSDSLGEFYRCWCVKHGWLNYECTVTYRLFTRKMTC